MDELSSLAGLQCVSSQIQISAKIRQKNRQGIEMVLSPTIPAELDKLSKVIIHE